MNKLFETTTIKGMKVKNRLVRSATWEGMAEPDGRPTERLVDFYRNLTRGGVGLIITGYTFVRPEGKQLPGKMGIHTDAFKEEYERMTRTIHEEGGRVALQIVHAGGQTDSKAAGRQPLAPTALKVDQFPETPMELTKNDIKEIIQAFGKGAERAKSWGFDAVQLHGAHGYLINQFLSPLTNRRTDEYGGGIDNRSRFLLEVFENVREAVGDEFPVMIKLNASDNLEGGLEMDDALFAAERLSSAGIDAIEISAGTPASGERSPARGKISKPEREGYHLVFARKFKEKVSCPVMVVGGFRSHEVAEQAIKEDGMDYISMARPFIREPDLPNRWLSGDHRPARCISCNKCFMTGMEESGIYCAVEKKEREKAGA